MVGTWILADTHRESAQQLQFVVVLKKSDDGQEPLSSQCDYMREQRYQ